MLHLRVEIQKFLFLPEARLHQHLRLYPLELTALKKIQSKTKVESTDLENTSVISQGQKGFHFYFWRDRPSFYFKLCPFLFNS
jgi:hypothetical protein